MSKIEILTLIKGWLEVYKILDGRTKESRKAKIQARELSKLWVCLS